jgi:hypothetical protein
MTNCSKSKNLRTKHYLSLIYLNKNLAFLKKQTWRMACPIRNVLRKLTALFVQNVSPWLQNQQKTVFWLYFRGLNQNISPPWIFKSHIRNLHECVAEESVHIAKESFVKIPNSFFCKSCFKFPKIKKFLLFLRNIFELIRKCFPSHVSK